MENYFKSPILIAQVVMLLLMILPAITLLIIRPVNVSVLTIELVIFISRV